MTTELDALVVRLHADAAPLRRDLAGAKAAFADLEGQAKAFGEGLETALEDSIAPMEEIGDIAGRSFERLGDVLADFAATGRLAFSDLREIALDALGDIANALIESGLNNVFGKGSSSAGFFNNFFSGLLGLAHGGPTAPQRPVIVGEQGPELFVPRTGGNIVPNGHAGAGAAPVTNITVNVSGVRDEGDLRRSAGQIATGLRRAMARAERNL